MKGCRRLIGQGFRGASWLRRWQAACAALILGLAQPALAAEAYRLGAGDQVRIVVVEDPQLTGNYWLSDAGTVSMPGAKPVSLLGLTAEEAADAVRTAVSARLVEPTVSLDVAQIRPFYILGDVAKPGPYPGQLNLNLYKAIAIAGGFRDGSEVFQASVTGIRAQESLVTARRQLFAAKVQLARLQAELADAPTFGFQPPQADGQADPEAADIVAREVDLFGVRKAGFERQMELLRKESGVRAEEIAALQARIDATLKQLDLLKEEAATVQDLVNRSLAPSSRIYQLNREEAAILSTNLQTTVLLNQARQARNQLDIQLANLPRDRRIEVLTSIQDTTSNIDKLNRQIAADRGVLQESADFGFSGGISRPERVYRLQHEDGSVTDDVEDPSTPVRPGDVIEVKRRMAQD